MVCGDHPGPWYDGDFIECPRVNPVAMREKHGARWRRRWIKWGDSVNKMMEICASPLVQERFLWLYDDHFFTGKMRYEELAQPYYWKHQKHFLKEEKRTWREVKRRTMHDLHGRGFTTYDFSCHQPSVFHKSRMVETMELFDVLHRPRLLESLYMNHHYGRVAEKMPSNTFRYSARKNAPSLSCKIYNSGNGKFSENRDKIISAIIRAK